MAEIQIAVLNKKPSVIGDIKCIVADNSDYTIRFTFDDQWKPGAKTVYFVLDNGFAFPAVRMTGDTVSVPRQETGGYTKRLYVGVEQGETSTSEGIGLRVLSSITDMIDDNAVQPEPSMWEDILARVEWLEKHGGGGGGIALPPITETDDGKVLMASGGEWVAAELPKYDGVYAVTPSTAAAKVLDTGQKFVDADIRIEKIPYYEIDNTSGGVTVYIGSDDEITFE